MHENTRKLAHTSVAGEATSTVIYVLAWRNLFATCYSNFSSRISRCMNVKCYTFACEVLISSRVDTTSCKLLFNCTRKITNSVLICFLFMTITKAICCLHKNIVISLQQTILKRRGLKGVMSRGFCYFGPILCSIH